MRVPLSTAIQLNEQKLPCEVMWIQNQWILNFEVCPVAKSNEKTSLTFNTGWLPDPKKQYAFHSTMMTLLWFNDISVRENPRVRISGFVGHCEFSYKLNEGESVMIPNLPDVGPGVRVVASIGTDDLPAIKVIVDRS
jgi:hypothetical protein